LTIKTKKIFSSFKFKYELYTHLFDVFYTIPTTLLYFIQIFIHNSHHILYFSPLLNTMYPHGSIGYGCNNIPGQPSSWRAGNNQQPNQTHSYVTWSMNKSWSKNNKPVGRKNSNELKAVKCKPATTCRLSKRRSKS